MDENQKKTFYKETKYKNYSKFEFINSCNLKLGFPFFKGDIAYGFIKENKFYFYREFGPSMYFFDEIVNSISSIEYLIGTKTEKVNIYISKFRINGPTFTNLLSNHKNWTYRNKKLPEENYWNS